MGRIKGTVFVKVVKSLRSYGDKARDVLPSSHHHFLTSRILSTEWHDEGDYFELMRGLSKLLPPSDVEVWEFMGRDSARVDLEGIYKTLCRPGDVAGTLKNLTPFWTLRHDSGEMTVDIQDSGSATIELEGYALEEPEVCRSIAGTIWQFLDQAGARDFRVNQTACTAQGADRCTWQASWTD